MSLFARMFKKKEMEEEFEKCHCIKCDDYLGDEISKYNAKIWEAILEADGYYFENKERVDFCNKCKKYTDYLKDKKKKMEEKIREKKEEKYKIKRDEETRIANIKYYKKRAVYLKKRDKYLTKIEEEVKK